MNLKKFRDVLDTIPKKVRQFFLRAAIFFIVWKLLYTFVLMPSGIPNVFLTNFTALGTAEFLTAVMQNPATATYTVKAAFIHTSEATIGIGHSCNALEVFVLYIGFIFCIPTSFKKQLIYCIGGVVLIYLANVLRCAGLFYLLSLKSTFFHIAHKYVFKFVLYALVFLLWYFYTKPKPATVSA